MKYKFYFYRDTYVVESFELEHYKDNCLNKYTGCIKIFFGVWKGYW